MRTTRREKKETAIRVFDRFSQSLVVARSSSSLGVGRSQKQQNGKKRKIREQTKTHPIYVYPSMKFVKVLVKPTVRAEAPRMAEALPLGSAVCAAGSAGVATVYALSPRRSPPRPHSCSGG